MSHLCLWAIGGDLPVKVLAVIGAFTLGGFLGGWALSLTAKFAFNQKVPNWLAWTMRLLTGLVAGWIAWLWLFGAGGGGFGGGSGVGLGGIDDSNSKDRAADKSGKDEKKPDPEETPKAKDPDSKSKKDGPGIGSGETINVEVLGDESVKKLAGGNEVNLEKRYRLADAPTSLRSLEEIKALILERLKHTPPLQKLNVIIYLNSPAGDSAPVKRFVQWAGDIGDSLVIEEKYPSRTAPLK